MFITRSIEMNSKKFRYLRQQPPPQIYFKNLIEYHHHYFAHFMVSAFTLTMRKPCTQFHHEQTVSGVVFPTSHRTFEKPSNSPSVFEKTDTFVIRQKLLRLSTAMLPMLSCIYFTRRKPVIS